MVSPHMIHHHTMGLNSYHHEAAHVDTEVLQQPFRRDAWEQPLATITRP